jgi:hypothetical protein
MGRALMVKRELAHSSPSESADFAPLAPLRDPPEIRVYPRSSASHPIPSSLFHMNPCHLSPCSLLHALCPWLPSALCPMLPALCPWLPRVPVSPRLRVILPMLPPTPLARRSLGEGGCPMPYAYLLAFFSLASPPLLLYHGGTHEHRECPSSLSGG